MFTSWYIIGIFLVVSLFQEALTKQFAAVSSLSSSNLQYSFVALTWNANGEAFAAGQLNAGIILKSSDFGVTWTQVGTSVSFGALYGITANTITPTSTTYYLAVDASRYTYVANGTGVSWKRMSSRASFSLYGVSLGSNGNAFVVGGTNTIRRSSYSSSFATWTSLTTDAQDTTWFDVSTIDGVNVIVVGANGTIYYSSNSGSQWTQASNLKTTSDLYCVDHANQTIAMVGGDGFLAKTTDAGNSWSVITTAYPSNYTARFHSLSMISTTEAYVAVFPSDGQTSLGLIYKTVDGGSSWTVIYSSSVPLYSLSMFNSDFGVAGAGAHTSLLAVFSGKSSLHP